MRLHHTVTGNAPPARGLVQQHSVEVSCPISTLELQCDLSACAMHVHIAFNKIKVGHVKASLPAAHDLTCHSTQTATWVHTRDAAKV